MNHIIIKFPMSSVIIVKECRCLFVYLSGVMVLSAFVIYSADSDFHIMVFSEAVWKRYEFKGSLDSDMIMTDS